MIHKTSKNSQKSLKFTENSHKIKTNQQWVENKWKNERKSNNLEK